MDVWSCDKEEVFAARMDTHLMAAIKVLDVLLFANSSKCFRYGFSSTLDAQKNMWSTDPSSELRVLAQKKIKTPKNITIFQK